MGDPTTGLKKISEKKNTEREEKKRGGNIKSLEVLRVQCHRLITGGRAVKIKRDEPGGENEGDHLGFDGVIKSIREKVEGDYKGMD